jgi:hypothetical protein
VGLGHSATDTLLEGAKCRSCAEPKRLTTLSDKPSRAMRRSDFATPRPISVGKERGTRPVTDLAPMAREPRMLDASKQVRSVVRKPSAGATPVRIRVVHLTGNQACRAVRTGMGESLRLLQSQVRTGAICGRDHACRRFEPT